MKKAFTMIELVFVMVIIAILASLAIPNFEQNRIRQAAEQLVSHIRYTQHLALMDNKFQPISNNSASPIENKRAQYWYKGRWQLVFGRSVASNNEWSYSIFSDSPLSINPDEYDGRPSIAFGELALNPTNKNQFMSGGHASGNFAWDDSRATRSLNIGNEYGVRGFFRNANCGANRIAFDSIGRPIIGDMSNDVSATSSMLQNQCVFTLCSIDVNPCIGIQVQIAIEPETGYTHIL